MRILLTAATGTRKTLFWLDADTRLPWTDLTGRLEAELGVQIGAQPVLIDGKQTPAVTSIGDAGLRYGSEIVFGSGVEPEAVIEGSVDLCVAGGVGGGQHARLDVGETLVRVDETGRLLVDDPDEFRSPAIVVLVHVDGSVAVRSAPDTRPSADPIELESSERPIGDELTPWPFGGHIRFGPTVLTVLPATRRDADLREHSDEGQLDFNRPPRLLPAPGSPTYRLPAEPQPPPRSPLPILAAAMPALLGVVTALVFQSPAFLLLALGSPLMAFGNWWSSRRHGKKSHRQQLKDHAAERAALEQEVRAAVQREQIRRRASSPGAAELHLLATTPSRRLWERRVSDPDHLDVRFGLATAASDVHIEDLAEKEHRRRSSEPVTSVPVTVSLRKAGVLGIAGLNDWPRHRARWIIGQLGVLQSPRDIQLHVLTPHDAFDAWSWSVWLPHLHTADATEPIARVAMSAEAVAARVAEIATVIAARQSARDEFAARDGGFTPNIVVLLDGARRLRALPGVVGILRDGPAVGVYAICLDEHEQYLPEECTAVAIARADGGLLLRRHGYDELDQVVVDDVADTWFEDVARSIAPVQDVTASESEGLIPDSVRLVDVLGVEDLDADDLRRRWASRRGSTEAVVGVSIDGPFALDLVRDGPHALVAGTTGAGKSEFLQTVVASLALVNTPETMNFVLVDYKGGAAFSACEALPHTVGMVTDLDAHLVERALTSLRAELTRREHVLADIGAKDLEAYLQAQQHGHPGPILPRLVIVIDEFAAMAKELPDFVTGLVNIAQRGRSLGIHLILATQRPSGVISAEIRANTNLRVALRMTDKSESSDVIDAPDAARITPSQPGRAFARLGHASLLPFQSARVGGPRLDRATTTDLEPLFLRRLTPGDLASPSPQRTAPTRAATDDTDLAVIVETLSEAARLAGFSTPRSPWLTPLPQRLRLEELSRPNASDIVWGLEDDPTLQRQLPAAICPDEFGHMYIIGAPGSGRSTALRTIALSAASTLPVTDLHIHAIDCGNGALAVLADLPHSGAIVNRTQADRASRLLTRLRAELGRRQQILADGNFANAAEQRAHVHGPDRLPHLLMLIDRWESFVTTLGDIDGGALTDVVHQLLREGESAGIHLIVSGDRTLMSSRMGSLTDDMLLLRLTDRTDYGMAGIDHRRLPGEIPPGRGFRSGSGREIHVAVLGNDPSGRAQTDAARHIADTLTASGPTEPGTGPFRVDDLPATLTIEQAYTHATIEAAQPMWAMLGVGGDTLTTIGMDLQHDAPTFIVAGPARSGRSSMLAVMAESLLRGGTELVILAPRASPLRALQDRRGVRATITDTDITELQLAPHLEPDGTPVVLLVDDGELLHDLPANTWLRSYLRTAADRSRGLVLAGDVDSLAGGFSGWQVDVKKNRRGALLSPQSTLNGDLIGVRLSRSSITAQVTPGRALVHLGSGNTMSVLVPTCPAPHPTRADTFVNVESVSAGP